jgi:hypothetical protein
MAYGGLQRCVAWLYKLFSSDRGQGLVESLPDVENDDRDPFSAPLTEDEVLEHLPHVRYDRSIEGVILAVELRLAFHTPEFDVGCFLTHNQYFTIGA